MRGRAPTRATDLGAAQTHLRVPRSACRAHTGSDLGSTPLSSWMRIAPPVMRSAGRDQPITVWLATLRKPPPSLRGGVRHILCVLIASRAEIEQARRRHGGLARMPRLSRARSSVYNENYCVCWNVRRRVTRMRALLDRGVSVSCSTCWTAPNEPHVRRRSLQR